MTTKNIFEYASRNKLRFASTRGELTAEQLWDVPLRSKDDFNLNAVAKIANEAVKAAGEESFIETVRTTANTNAEVTLDVIKRVIEIKLADENATKTRAENRIKKERLVAVLAEKQDGKLSALSERELKKQIAELES